MGFLDNRDPNDPIKVEENLQNRVQIHVFLLIFVQNVRFFQFCVKVTTWPQQRMIMATNAWEHAMPIHTASLKKKY